jgi:hypothetical protein
VPILFGLRGERERERERERKKESWKAVKVKLSAACPLSLFWINSHTYTHTHVVSFSWLERGKDLSPGPGHPFELYGLGSGRMAYYNSCHMLGWDFMVIPLLHLPPETSIYMFRLKRS